MVDHATPPAQTAMPIQCGYGREGLVPPEWLGRVPISRRLDIAEDAPIPTVGKEGERVILILLQGSARSMLRGRNGREHLLGYLGPGSLIGEQIALGGTELGSNLVCIAGPKCLVGEIATAGLLAAIRACPDLVLDLLRIIGSKTTTLLLDIERSAFASSAAQTAALLLKLSDNDGYVHVSQAHLAQFAGKTRMTVGTQLRRLARRGAIAQERSRIRLVDSASLEEGSRCDDRSAGTLITKGIAK